ncbi:phosphate ABC transporter ATP-binding protein [Longimonas halophila]|uniref:Phosphate ABC transporter ATP-binding protein n=1 Tax=Longimonas halophila TaxID=1469170 RepID=A0A2H3P428_9BACT|nr:phosphate ABC transporter ATP-binding protein PstB [Longimonas halophila]PEN06269.1 phosphate ABC transporter ATP-binding protein [Longimonas halophila]
MASADSSNVGSSTQANTAPSTNSTADAQQADATPTAAGRAGDAASEGEAETKIAVSNLNFWYGDDTHALQDITMDVKANRVTALIGPSGCGKSTLIRCFNRMNELIPNTTLEGRVHVNGQNIYQADPVAVRRHIGMVFQKPNPFPKTIYKNVIWGARINGYTGDEDALVERCLRQAALWDEVKDSLHGSAYNLSGGQQQRLCIARALAVEPDILLMDEPTSALDPVATGKFEDTISELRSEYTIVVVTHSMQQASRVSDETVFLYMGRLIEMGATEQVFTRPQKERTEAYVTGRFG